MSNLTSIQSQKIPTPREMMREKRPYLFSDSEIDQSYSLPRVNFAYHLETLTARKQEYEFEDFCRKLAEKELCTNLTIQTGPTGGGDSKADAETYPVAPEISERWWVGSPSAGSERWAFAFSAKKDWKPKLKSDVKKIVETGRSYAVIYFFTNQFASDKDKANLQDSLSKLHSCRIVIQDRAWIVEKVYANGHLSMAIDALAIEGAQAETIRKFGPKDAARSTELVELDKQIADTNRYLNARFQLASDCLHSAILARGLERPRAQVEARFEQAIRIADELGRTQQAMRIRYTFAWTMFWWFEDLPKFLALYDEVESRLLDSTQTSEVQHLYTLWSLTAASERNGRLEPEIADTERRRQTLLSILEPLANESARPNNSLEAQTYLAMIQMHNVMHTGTEAELAACWQEFGRILDDSKPLGTYPVEMLEGVLGELGAVVDSPEFDALYEKLVEVIRQRRSDGSAGEAHLKRAFQKLELDNPYEAIRWFGRAEELLIKREYQDELIEALLGSSQAYGTVGLRWAARNRALAALVHTLQDFRQDGRIEPVAWVAIKQLIWTELRLGRVPQALAAMFLAKLFLAALQFEGELAQRVDEDQMTYEMAFGLLLLRLSPDQLSAISKLHDSFEEYQLVIPGMATLFSLGQDQALRDEGYCPDSQSDQDIADFLEHWLNVPGAEHLPRSVLLLDRSSVGFTSTILGCQIRLETNTDPVAVGIAESVLGGLEGFMATSDESDILPHREFLRIVMRAVEGDDELPNHRLVEQTGASYFEISYSRNFRQDSADKMQKYRDWLQAIIVEIVCQFAVIKDIETWMTKIADDERGFARALAFSDMLTINGNVFGPKPPIRISDHIVADAREFRPLRSQPLADDPPRPANVETAKFGKGDSPVEFTKPENLKHTDRLVLSPIQLDLWNKAGWHGTAFMQYPNMPGPILALHFRDADAGRRIFEDWLDRWGVNGSDDNVRISIITGVTKANPFAYSMQIGPVYRTSDEQSGKTFMTMSRNLRLDASTPDNLNRFLEGFQKAGSYGLVAALTQPGHDFPTPMTELLLPRRNLEVRPAWMIGENDPDSSVMQDDDDPFIPDGMTDPPVRRALEKMREFRRSQRERG